MIGRGAYAAAAFASVANGVRLVDENTGVLTGQSHHWKKLASDTAGYSLFEESSVITHTHSAGSQPPGIQCDLKNSASLAQAEMGVVGTVHKAGYDIHYAKDKAHKEVQGFWNYTYQSWEPTTFQVFDKLARDKVVLDVGAWVGVTSLWLGHVAKKVVAMEPTERAFTELCENLKVNPDVQNKVSIVNAAMADSDHLANITNTGNSDDRLFSLIEVQTLSIHTLEQQHPELAQTGFVKIDTEGYERVIVPAMESFFKQKKASALVSLHPMFNTKEQVQGTVDKLKEIFPHLYEVDMKTPFNTKRDAYTYGDHGGADVVCSFTPLDAPPLSGA